MAERTEQLVVAVEDSGVMRVGVDGDDVVDGDEMRAAVALDRKMAGEAPRRAGAAERPIGAAAEFGIGIVAVAAGILRRGRDRAPAPCVVIGALLTAGIGFAAARAGSGTRINKNIPDRQNATTATMMASRSVDSAGAPAEAAANGNSVRPFHRRVVHAGHGDAEGDRGEDQRRPAAAAGGEPQRQAGRRNGDRHAGGDDNSGHGPCRRWR